jgi:hypothetical protein
MEVLLKKQGVKKMKRILCYFLHKKYWYSTPEKWWGWQCKKCKAFHDYPS